MNTSTASSRMQLKTNNFGKTYFYALLVGAVVGFLGGNAFRLLKSGCFDRTPLSQWIFREEVQSQDSGLNYRTDRNLVLIGVVTTPGFLATRIAAANNTWVKDVPGKVVIFIPEGSRVDTSISGIEIVELAGIDGKVSAHNKFSRILKYMYSHYLDKYMFLMIAYDDLFIRADQMTKFLHSLTPDQIRSKGTVYGKREKKASKFEEYFCIGDNAMFVPRVSLARFGRSRQRCARNAPTENEDVEFERCWIKSFTNVTCQRFDQDIFARKYQNVKISFAGSLDGKVIGDSIVLQNVETAQSAYRLHHHFLVARKLSLHRRLQSLKLDSSAMDALLSPWRRTPRYLSGFKTDFNATGGRPMDDTGPWVCIAWFMASPYVFNPHQKLTWDEKQSADEVAKQVALMAHKTRPRGQTKALEFDHIYSRRNKLHGLEYILRRRKRIWNTRITNLYARRPYLPVEMKEEFSWPDSPIIHDNGEIDYVDQECVQVILSLTGRYPIFLRFMKDFEDRLLKRKQKVSLLIVLYRNFPNDTSADVIDYMERLQLNYPEVTLNCTLMEGIFARGRAFQAAVQAFRDDDLLFFADIDLILDLSTIHRVRLNTKRGESVYAPMFFSEYDPGDKPRKNSSTPTYYDSDNGYWRKYSFGMVACYKSDFIRTGGYRLDIEGWGQEDVDLMDKFVDSGIGIFRSVDVEMSHIFHPIFCDPDLAKDQLEMCYGTKANSLAPVKVMAEFVYRTSSIFNRGK